MREMTRLALASAFGLALCAQARADMIYTFAATPVAGAPRLTDGLTMRFEVTDAALGTTFSVSGRGYGQPAAGDLADFVGMSYAGAGALPSQWQNTPAASSDAYSITAQIAADGTLTGMDATATDGGYFSAVALGLNGGSVHWYDSTEPCYPGSCQETGTWTVTDPPSAPVPEPASFALLGAGLIGLGAARWRQLKA